MIHCIKNGWRGRECGAIERNHMPLSPDPLLPREGQISFVLIDDGKERVYTWELKDHSEMKKEVDLIY